MPRIHRVGLVIYRMFIRRAQWRAGGADRPPHAQNRNGSGVRLPKRSETHASPVAAGECGDGAERSHRFPSAPQ